MTAEIPYIASIVNVSAILDRIRSAGTPPKFTHDFLKSTLGFASSNDRGMIKLLRSLGFLSADGTPTQRYNSYRGDQAGAVLATGLREGWADLFLADEKVYERSTSEIQSIAKSLTGAGESVSQKMASTFKALSAKADWTGPPVALEGTPPTGGDGDAESERVRQSSADDGNGRSSVTDAARAAFQLHHDIHIHLPPTTDVSVYRAIFQAIKLELM